LHLPGGYCLILSEGNQDKEKSMPSEAYQEIVRKIPLLSPQERERLVDFLQLDSEESPRSKDAAPASEEAEQNGAAGSPIRVVQLRSFDEERKWISQHREQYRGQFVALEGTRLLAHGNDEGDMIDQARGAGVRAPFVIYIETEEEEHHLSGWLSSRS
jgi:hypothetical protein